MLYAKIYKGAELGIHLFGGEMFLTPVMKGAGKMQSV
jgi:hypothetical protein